MTLNIKVSAKEYKLHHPSIEYIKNSTKFKVSVDMLEAQVNPIKNKYMLRLIGKKKKIKAYIKYLKNSGFKVKKR